MSGVDVEFVDTSLRDGQQSLWALRMRTEMMSPVLDDLDRAGLLAAEFLVPTTQFVRAVRELREDPWEWVRCGVRKMKKTPLRMTGGVRSYFSKVPACIEELLLARLADLGIRTSRISDPWNDFSHIEHDVAFLRNHGIDAVVNVIYSVSPRHTPAYYESRVRQAVAAGAERLCFKDVGGLLTPAAAAGLLPVVAGAAGPVPVEFHAHCNSGFAPYCALLAVDAGIRTIHTAVPPLANGTSQPSVFAVAANLAARGHVPMVELPPLRRISEHFDRVARVEGFPVGGVLEYDERTYHHQVPGGMRSTLRHHLAQVGMEERLEETLGEVARVRQDLGYPIMVTPLSQFVGTQAALNVRHGQRYAEVSDEIIRYALGQWGREALEVMDPGVREVILDRPRVAEIQARLDAPADEPTLAEMRKAYGRFAGDEELILRVFAGSGDRDLGLQRRPSIDSYEDYRLAHDPVTSLVARVAELGFTGRLEYRDPGGEVVIERGAAGRRR